MKKINQLLSTILALNSFSIVSISGQIQTPQQPMKAKQKASKPKGSIDYDAATKSTKKLNQEEHNGGHSDKGKANAIKKRIENAEERAEKAEKEIAEAQEREAKAKEKTAAAIKKQADEAEKQAEKEEKDAKNQEKNEKEDLEKKKKNDEESDKKEKIDAGKTNEITGLLNTGKKPEEIKLMKNETSQEYQRQEK